MDEIDKLREKRVKELHRIWMERSDARAFIQQALETIWGNHIEGFPKYEGETKERLEKATTLLWKALSELDSSELLRELNEKLRGVL